MTIPTERTLAHVDDVSDSGAVNEMVAAVVRRPVAMWGFLLSRFHQWNSFYWGRARRNCAGRARVHLVGFDGVGAVGTPIC
jgi:hypothetical protein